MSEHDSGCIAHPHSTFAYIGVENDCNCKKENVMTKEKVMLEAGTYIDSHWGHYQSVQVIGMGLNLGYEDKGLTNESLEVLIEAYESNKDEVSLTQKDGTPLELTNPYEGYSVAECVHEVTDDVETYINEHVPEGYWFGHHADIGDFGVWEQEDDDA